MGENGGLRNSILVDSGQYWTVNDRKSSCVPHIRTQYARPYGKTTVLTVHCPLLHRQPLFAAVVGVGSSLSCWEETLLKKKRFGGLEASPSYWSPPYRGTEIWRGRDLRRGLLHRYSFSSQFFFRYLTDFVKIRTSFLFELSLTLHPKSEITNIYGCFITHTTLRKGHSAHR